MRHIQIRSKVISHVSINNRERFEWFDRPTVRNQLLKISEHFDKPGFDESIKTAKLFANKTNLILKLS